MHAVQVALNISLAYVALSFLCSVLWIAGVELRRTSRSGRHATP